MTKRTVAEAYAHGVMLNKAVPEGSSAHPEIAETLFVPPSENLYLKIDCFAEDSQVEIRDLLGVDALPELRYAGAICSVFLGSKYYSIVGMLRHKCLYGGTENHPTYAWCYDWLFYDSEKGAVLSTANFFEMRCWFYFEDAGVAIHAVGESYELCRKDPELGFVPFKTDTVLREELGSLDYLQELRLAQQSKEAREAFIKKYTVAKAQPEKLA